MSTFMTRDPDGPGIPAYAAKIKESKEKDARKRKYYCRFNSGVKCAAMVCGDCGFNPERKRGAQDG